MFNCLDTYRSQYSDFNKAKYFASKTKYQTLCNSKKLNFYNKNIQLLNHIKTSSEWWKISNSIRTRAFQRPGCLSAEECLDHFSSMLQCPVNNSTVKWCLPFTIDPILDAPIESCELMSVVSL